MAKPVCLLMAVLLASVSLGRAADPLEAEFVLRLPPTLEGSDAPVITAIAVDPRGEYIAAAGDDHVIRVLSRRDWKVAKLLDLHEDWVRDLQFSPDGSLLASVANDGKLLLWERNAAWRTVEAMGDAPSLRAVRFSPDGTMLATVGFSPEVFLVGVHDERRPRLNCGCPDLRAVAYRGDGTMLGVAGRSGDLHLYDAVTGSSVEDVQLHSRRITAIAFVPNTSLAMTASEDGHAVIYDSAARRMVHDIVIEGTKLLAACTINEHFGAVAGSDNTIYILDIDGGHVIKRLTGHGGSVATLAYGDGVLYSGGFDTTIRTWSTATLAGTSRVAGAEAASEPDARTSRRPN